MIGMLLIEQFDRVDGYDDIIKNAITTMRHACKFIDSREKMHPDEIELYKDAIKQLQDLWISSHQTMVCADDAISLGIDA